MMTDTTETHTSIAKPEDLIGRFVIARCTGAGVHAGTLASLNGENGVTLTNSRRLWRWWAAESAFLSGVAAHDLHASAEKKSIVGAPVDIVLNGVHELIPCSPQAAASIQEYPTHDAD